MSWKFNPFTNELDYYEPSLYQGALSAAPASPVTGTMYYDTDDATLYVYDGGWVAIGSGTPAPTNCILLEDGSKLLLEDGSTLGLEA